MNQELKHHPDETAGILLAGGSYVVWGFVPLYWAMLAGTSPFEITLHRILWGAVFSALVTVLRGHTRHVLHILKRPRVLAWLALSSVLIAANWTIFIWCVSTHQLVESSLGYYLTPLVSIGVGIVLLGETVSRLRLAAIALAAVAVGVQALELGHVPWVAPALALSFGFYGYVRKRIQVDALDGLTIETMLMLPVALGAIGYWAYEGTGAFTASAPVRDLLLMGGGPVTAVPLTMFAAGAMRIRMTTLGFLQYLSPTLTLLVATLLMGEAFTRTDTVTFAFVWSALVLVGLEGRIARLRAAQPL